MARFSIATATSCKAAARVSREDNPIDLTGQINSVNDLFSNTCLTVADDPRTEAVVVQHANSGRRYLKEDGEMYKRVARDLPVIVSFVGDVLPADPQGVSRGGRAAVAGALGHDDSLSMLYRLASHPGGRRPPATRPSLPPPRQAPQGWAETMALCAAGATPAKWVILEPSDRAARACASAALPAGGEGAAVGFRAQNRTRGWSSCAWERGGSRRLAAEFRAQARQAPGRHPGAGDGGRGRRGRAVVPAPDRFRTDPLDRQRRRGDRAVPRPHPPGVAHHRRQVRRALRKLKL